MRTSCLEYRINKSKESYKIRWSNMHIADYKSDSSDDEDKDFYVAEFVWKPKTKLYSSSSHKLILLAWSGMIYLWSL